MRLILLRHGNTFESHETPLQVGSQTDLPLTETGKTQALDFAHYLIKEKIIPSAIYAGGLKRQIETAQIVAKELCIEDKMHLHEEALNEVDYGSWEGLSSEQILMGWPDEYAAWSQQSFWPEAIFGRSFDWHRDQIKEWMEHLGSIYKGDEMVVGVTSNGIMRFFYSLCKETNSAEAGKVKTGNFCELSLEGKELILKKWNHHTK